MSLSIAFCEHVAKTGRLTVSLDTDLDPTRLKLRIDGVNQPGKFIDTNWVGTLYQHTDGEWGCPGIGFGPSVASVFYVSPGTDFGVGRPPSTIGTLKTSPEVLLPLLWDAGFRVEQHLLYCVSIVAGESGFYVKARNWLPQDGFRPLGTPTGVEGPPAAWNKDHTQQGHSDRGLFQWNSKAHPDIPDADADDPARTCAWVFKKSGGGQSFAPWGHGAGGEYYAKFFPQMQPFVTAFLKGKT